MQLTKLWKPVALAILFLIGTGAAVAPSAHADTITYNVTFSDLGELTGRSDYNLNFILTPYGDANNSTTINFSNFNYGSGGSGPSNLGPLTDAGPFNESFSPFVAGDSLSFLITADFTPDADAPDSLAFGFFEGPGNYTETSTTPTTGFSGGQGFNYFTIDFFDSNPSVSTFAGTNPAMPAPTITVVATPEPQTWAMMFLGLGIVLFAIKRKKTTEDESSAVPVPIEPAQMR